MPEIKLRIDDLVLDGDNPRITHAEGQHEALQKIVKDQRIKLVRLAQSIAAHGLNPMDRLLVVRLNLKPERFIALEGNRRVAALKLLANSAAMSGLEMPAAMKTLIERAAQGFSRSSVEPISCVELGSRRDGDYWLQLRHKGEQEGVGIVRWSAVASQRFLERSPAVQALDLVTEHADLAPSQRAAITEGFPITTLQRFIEDRKVRQALGLNVKRGKLVTALPAAEVLKPLRRIVIDLATKRRRVGSLMKTEQMLEYVLSFDKDSAPDLSKATATERMVDEIPGAEFGRAAPRRPRRRSDPSDRKEVVPKACSLTISDNRIAEIHKELRTLKLDDAPNAIAVLMRVFLELSIDHFMAASKIAKTFVAKGGRTVEMSLDKKLAETVAALISFGVPKDTFQPITRDLSVPSSPMNVDLLHMYVHNRFATPSPAELKSAWDHAQPLFEQIWS